MATMAAIKAANLRAGYRAIELCKDVECGGPGYDYYTGHEPCEHTERHYAALYVGMVRNAAVTLYDIPGVAHLYTDGSILYLPDAGWGCDGWARVVRSKAQRAVVDAAFAAAK